MNAKGFVSIVAAVFIGLFSLLAGWTVRDAIKNQPKSEKHVP